MIRIRIFALSTLCLLLSPAGTAIAASSESSSSSSSVSANQLSACRQRIVREATTAHDDYRSYLYGSYKDLDGKIVVRTGGTTDKERTGIFETKGRLTSELVAPIVQSYRAMRCKSLDICEVLRQSLLRGQGSSTEPMTVSVLGCEDQQLAPYAECYFGTKDADSQRLNQSDITDMIANCNQLINDTLRMERASLRSAVAYDASYRALLQFAGMMDYMLKDIPAFSYTPIREMIGLLGKLHQIPCFIGQCDVRNDKDVP